MTGNKWNPEERAEIRRMFLAATKREMTTAEEAHLYRIASLLNLRPNDTLFYMVMAFMNERAETDAAVNKLPAVIDKAQSRARDDAIAAAEEAGKKVYSAIQHQVNRSVDIISNLHGRLGRLPSSRQLLLSSLVILALIAGSIGAGYWYVRKEMRSMEAHLGWAVDQIEINTSRETSRFVATMQTRIDEDQAFRNALEGMNPWIGTKEGRAAYELSKQQPGMVLEMAECSRPDWKKKRDTRFPVNSGRFRCVVAEFADGSELFWYFTLKKGGV